MKTENIVNFALMNTIDDDELRLMGFALTEFGWVQRLTKKKQRL